MRRAIAVALMAGLMTAEFWSRVFEQDWAHGRKPCAMAQSVSYVSEGMRK